ncbi:hypothetical protein AVEN_260113-1 [Araneus ventricosus]|uniref:Uncharacterized protein n=1 Tax=Araneus ventricosus TaxID=182803 RepID=A0A4Y2DHZ2_ARAVE|nr:hypothetical protein AVEN_260113-1 [Araneus ventricosus]
MRRKKQTERQQLLMESSLAYLRGKEAKVETKKEDKNSKKDQTLGYHGVVNSVIPEEDVLLRGQLTRRRKGQDSLVAESRLRDRRALVSRSSSTKYPRIRDGKLDRVKRIPAGVVWNFRFFPCYDYP